MKIRLMMRDKEYEQAFLSKISGFHSDIYAEVIDLSELSNTDETSIVLTDYDIESLSQSNLDRISARIVSISNKVVNTPNFAIFKYQSFTSIMAQIAGYYYSLTGDRVRYKGSTEIICVCGDCNDYNYGYVSKSIASKLKYCKGGEFLLISTRPINPYTYIDEQDRGLLSKLLYTLDTKKNFSIEEFCRCDEYGIHYLNIGVGINKISLLDWKSLKKLIFQLRNYFNGIVIDIGATLTMEAIKLINEADCVWWISDKYTDRIISQVVGESENKNIRILDSNREDIDLVIDEIIKDGGVGDKGTSS